MHALGRDAAFEHRLPQRDERRAAQQRIRHAGAARSRSPRDWRPRARSRRSRGRRRSAAPTAAAPRSAAAIVDRLLAGERRRARDPRGRRNPRPPRVVAASVRPRPERIRLLERDRRDRAAVVSRRTVTRGRPRSSTHARLHAARSASVRRVEYRIRSVHVALPNLCAFRYSRRPSRKFVGADQQLELPHDDRRLLINDRAVERSGFVQVGELLPNRIGAVGAVHVVGGRVVLKQEPQLVVHVRERRIHDLRRHEVGEDLLHPHVVEPLHRHQIAEPHVRGLVRNQAGAAEQLVLRRRLVEQQAAGVVEDRAGMLHAAELERRNQHEVELAERIGDARCSPRARRAPAHADRRSPRGSWPPWRRRSRDGASGTCGRSRSAVSTLNLPAANANRYVEIGCVSSKTRPMWSGLPTRPISLPFDTAVQSRGMFSISFQRALRSG